MDKHHVVPGDMVKVVDQYNSHKPPQVGVVVEVIPSGGVVEGNRVKMILEGGKLEWRWSWEVSRL